MFSDDDFIEKHENGMLLKWIIPNAQKNEMEPVLVELLSGRDIGLSRKRLTVEINPTLRLPT